MRLDRITVWLTMGLLPSILEGESKFNVSPSPRLMESFPAGP